MKKILCVFLAVAVTAACFAQELTFDGVVNSGLGLVYTNQKGNTNPKVAAYGVDSERYLGRFRLNGSYTGENKTAGANFRLQVQGKGYNSDPANGISLAYGYGWVKPLDMLTIKAGIVEDSLWQTADVIYNDDQGEGAGLLVKLTPLPGLDIGAGAYTATTQGGGDDNFFAPSSVTETIRWDAVKYTFNLAYTRDKAFRLMLSGRTWNQAAGRENTPHALTEFRLLSVNNLTAVAVVEADKLDKDFSDTGVLNFYEAIGYKAGALGLGLNAAQYKSMASGSDLCLNFNPWVSYALAEGKIVPRLDVHYFLGGEKDGNNYHRRAFKVSSYNTDAWVASGRPSVKINFNSKTVFEIGDAVYYQKPATGDSVLTNILYADLVVKF